MRVMLRTPYLVRTRLNSAFRRPFFDMAAGGREFLHPTLRDSRFPGTAKYEVGARRREPLPRSESHPDHEHELMQVARLTGVLHAG